MMDQVSLGTDKAVLSLSKSFYSEEAIEATRKAYGDVCKCSVKEQDGKFLVEITSSSDIPLETCCLEFCNHLLATMKDLRGAD